MKMKIIVSNNRRKKRRPHHSLFFLHNQERRRLLRRHNNNYFFQKKFLLFSYYLLISLFSTTTTKITLAAVPPETKKSIDHPPASTECLATDLDFTDYHCFLLPTKFLSDNNIDCINEHPDCQSWADRGECSKNPQYMLLGCRKSCKTCIPLEGLIEYGNVPQIVPVISKKQEVFDHLQQTRIYQNQHAQHSVESFKTCRNLSSMCTYESLVGECQRNPDWAQKECPAACRLC